MNKIQDLLNGDLVLGHTFTAHGLGIIPIIAQEIPNFPHLDTLDQALERGTITIREVSEEGEVPTLVVDNNGDHPLLLLEGEELFGAALKQNRIINTTVIVLSNTICKIPVSCIERRRWNYKQDESPKGDTAIFRARSRAVQKQGVTASLLRQGTFHSNQSQRAVWDETDRLLRDLHVHSETADYREARAHVSHRLEQVVDSVPPLENQIGAIFTAKHGVLGAELIGSPFLFAASIQKLVRSFAFDVVFAEDIQREQFAKAENWWENTVQAEFTRHRSPGAGEDIRLQTSDLIGSGLLWGRNLIHLSAFPVEKANGNEQRATTRRTSITERRRSLLRSNIE
jgi:hypothetical protein